MPRGRPKGSGKAAAKPKTNRKRGRPAKSKSGVPPPIVENTVKPSEVTKHISAKALKDLLNRGLRLQKDLHDTNMEFGKEIASAVEHRHLNKGMYNEFKRIWKKAQDPAVLRNWRDEFDLYWDLLGLDDIYQQAPPLFSAGDDPAQPANDQSGEIEAEGVDEENDLEDEVEVEPFPEEGVPAEAAE